LTGLRLEPML